jgi:hypothetical protein
MKAELDNQEEGFFKELEKRIRNKKKKLDKIAQTEKKVKSKEVKLNEEQRGMLEGKEVLLQQLAEAEGILKLYQEENPKKGAPRKSSTVDKKVEAAPEVPKINEGEVIRKTLS